ncbi:MAG: hypothetical protein MK209_08175 [Planctomycetes bacterium]|nr:hypothetical protein [Planctomycetota bacterium]
MVCLLVLTCATAWQQPAAAPPPDLFAMTRSGVQVEVSERPMRGALDLVTPFGIYHTPTDPVAVVLERKRDRAWMATLRAAPDASLVPAIETFAENGQVSALIEIAEVAIRRSRADEVRAALTAIEVWGAHFDPVEDGIEGASRIDWLWERVQSEKGLSKLLIGARLASEVTFGQNGVGDRQLTLTTLSRALESSDPLVQRVTLLVTRAQLMDDPRFGARVQQMSLFGNRINFDLAGATAVQLRPTAAREYWVKALMRAEDKTRINAAIQLANHLPKYAPKPFVMLMAIGDRKAPAKFRFLGGSIQVVVDRSDPIPLRQIQFSFSNGGSERNEYLENASTIKAVRADTNLRDLLLRLLMGVSGEDVDRSPEQWVEWYENRQVNP